MYMLDHSCNLSGTYFYLVVVDPHVTAQNHLLLQARLPHFDTILKNHLGSRLKLPGRFYTSPLTPLIRNEGVGLMLFKI
jgi:hypothetical protein